MNCHNEKCVYFSKLMESNCSYGDDTKYAEKCMRDCFCYFKPADLPEAGASAERISSVVRSNATTGWISVKDRLPDKKFGRYLVVVKRDHIGYQHVYIKEFENDFWDTVNITHWMPLPEPPEV